MAATLTRGGTVANFRLRDTEIEKPYRNRYSENALHLVWAQTVHPVKYKQMSSRGRILTLINKLLIIM